MTVQKTDRIIVCYRIGDPDGTYPIFDATGSTISPGRWNTSKTPCIYTSQHYSTAMLEKLVHGNGHLPPNQHYITITISTGVSYEIVTPDHLPGWDAKNQNKSRVFGETWLKEKRSLILFIPSYVARQERNILINPHHSEFGIIECSMAEPVWWDDRLY